MATLRRLLIFLGLILFVVLLVFYEKAPDNGGAGGTNQSQTVDLSPEEMKALLEEAVRLKWEGQTSGDWLQVYENASPHYRARTKLVDFMQGRDRYYFKNWKLIDATIDGLTAVVKVQYDWGVHLDIPVDVGTPGHDNVEREENYYFEIPEGRWYPGQLPGDPAPRK